MKYVVLGSRGSPFGGIPRNWKLDCLCREDYLYRAIKFPLRGDP